jgi:predicted DNA-binding antitoxin AbrB/MazE fold protein
MEVSERFWAAVKDKNANEAKKYITASTLSKDATENLLPLDDVYLGRTVMDAERAWVDTTVIIAGDDSFELPLETILLKEGDQWKVDYDATVATLSRGSTVARVLGSIVDLSGQFADELDRSLEEIQKAIPEVQKEIERIEENIIYHLPELQRRMNEFLKQLEEALEDLNRDTGPRGTTEI